MNPGEEAERLDTTHSASCTTDDGGSSADRGVNSLIDLILDVAWTEGLQLRKRERVEPLADMIDFRFIEPLRCEIDRLERELDTLRVRAGEDTL